MAYFFFTEPDKLQEIQHQDNAYGPISENEYRLVNLYSATTSPKAFAVSGGNLLVQENSANADLVNIVLKPTEQPDLDLPKISYIIYKNILKSSIIDSQGIIADRSQNTLTKKIWESFDLQTAAFGDNPDVDLPDNPLPEDVLGYNYSSTGTGEDLALDSDSLDLAFYNNVNTLFFITAGDYLGDFQADKFGFLITTEKIGSNLSFKAAREAETKLSFTALSLDATDADKFKRKHDKEDILSYLDSCAFFGSFYAKGLNVDNGSGSDVLTGQDLFDQITSKHYNKDKVYIDIRNEYYDSLNYYDDLGDNLYWSLDNTENLVQVNYYRDNWPVLTLNNSEVDSANTDKNIKLSFIKNEGTTPLIYFKRAYNEDVGIGDLPQGKDKFVELADETDENGFAILPSDILLPSLNNEIIANYFQLKYFSKITDDPDETALISKRAYPDNLFPIFDMSIPFNQASTGSYFKLYYDSSYIDKTLVNTADFSVNIGIAKDPELTTLIAFPFTYNNNVQRNADNIIPIGGMEEPAGSLFLNSLIQKANSVKLVKGSFLIDGVSRDYLKFEPNDDNTTTNQIGQNYTFDDVAIITLTDSEFAAIKAIKETEFPDNYKVYLGLDNIVAGTDDLGVSYTMFKYVLKGIKEDNGSIVQHSADTNIDAITDLKIIGQEYQRNPEELVGFVNLIDGKTREDSFIEKIIDIKTVVDDFITQIKGVDINQPSANDIITSIAKKSFTLLWSTAKTYVQANPSNPDDRPLYWGRLKMQVALKQLPFFRSSVIGSNVITDSPLDQLILISEECSRNYLNVSFAAAPTGSKKILVTGFDPFSLADNIEQSNPSGCCALALADSIIADNIGYIQTMIVPVRYPDFDSSKSSTEGMGTGIIEKYVGPWINEVDMIITISQSLPGDYNIDKYSTATRRGDGDNLNYQRVRLSHCMDIGDSSNEWIITTLPASFIVAPVKYNWTYVDATGAFIDNSDQLHPPQEGAVLNEGSGSNYLSNEIFYRVAHLRKTARPELPTGHFHISKLQSSGQDFSGTQTQDLITKVKTGISSGVTGL